MKKTLVAAAACAAASIPVGPGEIKLSYARLERDALVSLQKPTSSKVALGYVHNLSRRSAMYVTVARISNSNGAAQSLAGVVTSPNSASTGTEFGFRTAF
jgi:hypothetical protein